MATEILTQWDHPLITSSNVIVEKISQLSVILLNVMSPYNYCFFQDKLEEETKWVVSGLLQLGVLGVCASSH